MLPVSFARADEPAYAATPSIEANVNVDTHTAPADADNDTVVAAAGDVTRLSHGFGFSGAGRS